MPAQIPSNKPKMTRSELIDRISTDYPNFVLPAFFIAGIRGYYKKTTGANALNERRIYDDAIFFVGQNDYQAFNANCDPAAFQKHIATLIPGVWPVYKFDLHKGQYLAICQRAGKVTVSRDQEGLRSGNFGINIHRGGINTTSSLGCQTLPPAQWDLFISKAQEMAKEANGTGWKAQVYTYVLMEN